jgi:uncharacterized SAM-dependent methyltransferase
MLLNKRRTPFEQSGEISSDSAEKFRTLSWALRHKGMPARYVTVDRETPMLLPPDLRDWVCWRITWCIS